MYEFYCYDCHELFESTQVLSRCPDCLCWVDDDDEDLEQSLLETANC